MDLNKFTDEQKEKIKACKTPEELLSLASSEGYEPTDDELKAISGGGVDWIPCPNNMW